MDEYIKYNIKNNNFEKIYEKKKSSTNITNIKERTNNISVKTESVVNPSINNNITSSNENVNITKIQYKKGINCEPKGSQPIH